jgi:hypothetical protein
MATNKHAQIRYQALDRCFKTPDGSISLKT